MTVGRRRIVPRRGDVRFSSSAAPFSGDKVLAEVSWELSELAFGGVLLRE